MDLLLFCGHVLVVDFEVRERLAEVVKQARGERSQRQFAKDLGVSYAAIRSWEQCESFPGQENLELLAADLGQSLEEFLFYLRGEDPYPTKPRIRVAEDLLPFVNELSDAEAARLIQMIANCWCP